MARTNDMKEKDDSALHTLVTRGRAQLRALRFGSAGAGAGKGASPKKVRATIARALTELRARTHQRKT